VQEAARDRPAESGARLQQRIEALRRQIATRITLLDEDARVLADSEQNPAEMESHANRPEIRQAQEARFGTATRFSSTLNEPMMYVALRADEESRPVAYVRVALPLDKVQEQSAWLHRVVGSAAALTAAAALALALWLARRVTKPLHELTAGAQRIAAGDYGQKIYATGHDEVAVLARSFNEMSQCLATQFAQLAADRQQLRMILSGMVEGVVALDAEQQILFANERAAQLLEFSPQAATGRKLWEVVRQRSLQEVVRRALSEPQPCQAELSFNGPLAKNILVHAARLPGSPARGAVLVLHDNSELRRLEGLRRDFVANVSHELKTPLAVIKACVETVLDGAADDREHRTIFLEKIAEQTERLHALILDLLSLARIESTAEAFSLQAVSLEPAVKACLERHRARAEANSQRLEAVTPPAADKDAVMAWADEEAVDQILDNLVDNALKYTPAGGSIHVHWQSTDGQACLEVRDTGVGIPEHDLPRVFERFYRVDKARSRELGGTGLGLAIVKHLVQAMHGEVRVTSNVGQGTTFTVLLPGAPAA
jgi:two-component system phosphate regulon sensor histidine kinase PhoR